MDSFPFIVSRDSTTRQTAMQFKKSGQNCLLRKGVVFQLYNAKPHTYLVTRQKLLKLGWGCDVACLYFVPCRTP